MLKKLASFVIAIALVCSFTMGVAAAENVEGYDYTTADKVGKIVSLKDTAEEHVYSLAYKPASLMYTEKWDFGDALVRAGKVISFLDNSTSDYYFTVAAGNEIRFAFDVSEADYSKLRVGLKLPSGTYIQYDPFYQDGKLVLDLTLQNTVTFQPYISNSTDTNVSVWNAFLAIK